MIETVFDTLNAKAAIVAAQETAPGVPLWLSFTAIDRSGRNLSGQTVEAFLASVEHAEPLIVGVNCSLGAAQMRPFVETRPRRDDVTSHVTRTPACRTRSASTTSGRPTRVASSASSPRRARQRRRRVLRHDARARRRIAESSVTGARRVPVRQRRPLFSGLEPFEIGEDTGFVMSASARTSPARPGSAAWSRRTTSLPPPRSRWSRCAVGPT